MKILYLLLLVAINAQAGEHFANSDKPIQAAEAFARAAHQGPLEPTDADSLRVWIRSYMTGSVETRLREGWSLNRSQMLSLLQSST